MSDKPEHENPESWLEGLPAPDKDDAGWEASAEATVKAAASAKAAEADALLLEAPKLDAEPGEPSAPGVDAAPMSGPASGPVSGVPSSRMSGPSSGGRGSLKDLAQRTAARASHPASVRAADQAPASAPAASTRMPRAKGSDPSSAAASRRPARKVAEADADDSGFVDLKAVHSAATPEQAARAEKTELGSADLLDDEMASVPPGPASSEVLSSGHVDFASASSAAAAVKAAASAGPASAGPASPPANDAGPASAGAAPASAAAKAPAAGSNSNTWIGLGIGVMGIAAAIALWITMGHKNSADEPLARTTQVEAPAEVVGGAQTARPKPGAEPDEEKSSGVALSELDDAEDGEGGGAAEPTGGALALGPGKASDAPDGKKTEDAPPTSGDKGDLGDEMAKAAGDDDDDGEEPVPAASDPKDKNQSIPEAPPQGKVQAAIGSVLGGARACVAGGDDVSRATITFGSSGAVTSVSVSGWAAGKGAAGCIKSALQAANVGRFARSSYTIGVTVRP